MNPFSGDNELETGGEDCRLIKGVPVIVNCDRCGIEIISPGLCSECLDNLGVTEDETNEPLRTMTSREEVIYEAVSSRETYCQEPRKPKQT